MDFFIEPKTGFAMDLKPDSVNRIPLNWQTKEAAVWRSPV